MAGRAKDKNNSARKTDNSNQKIVLEMERDLLLDVLDCQKIVPSLLIKGVLNDADQEYICGTEENKLTPREQNSRLLKIITSRIPDGFGAFMETLEEKHFDQAFFRLSQTLNRPGSPNDDMMQPTMRDSSRTTHATNSFAADASGLDSFEREGEDPHDTRCATVSDLGDVQDRVETLEFRVDKLELFETEHIGTDVQRNQGQIEQLTRELNKTKDEVKRIESEKNEMMATFKAENDALSERLAQTLEELKEKNEKIAELEEQIERLQRKNERLRKELDQLNKDVRQVRTERDQDRREVEKMKAALEKTKQDQEEDRDLVNKMKMEIEQTTHYMMQFAKGMQQQQQQQLFLPRQNQAGNRGSIPGRRLHANMGPRSATDLGEMAIKGTRAAKNYRTSNNMNK